MIPASQEPLPGVATEAALRAAAPVPERTDKWIWGIFLSLMFISVVELYSASSREIRPDNIYAPLISHLVHLAVGTCLVVWIQRKDPIKIFRATPWVVGAAIVLMVVTLVMGERINGARRSINLLVFSLQSAEFLKLAAVMLIAYLLCQSSNPRRFEVETWRMGVCAAFVGLFGALLITQGFTNTVLMMAICVSLMLVAGMPLGRLLAILGVLAVVGLAVVGVKVLVDGNLTDTFGRWDVWTARLGQFGSMEKFNQPITDQNAQEMYSYIAQAHGGVTGVGPGCSRETSRLALANIDFIFAIIVEEIGLVGGLLVMVLYMALLCRALALAHSCTFIYPALLVVGMAVFIVFQALFHMAIVTGSSPVSGQPLPLISKGGSSILVTCCAFGIMLSVSRHALRRGNRRQIRDAISTLPEPLTAINPTQDK